MQGPAQPRDTIEFLKEVYKNQLEQRWRGSRNQDWGVIGIVATLMAAAVAVQYAELESSALWLKWLFPLIVALVPIIGLRILHLHQGVMNHANYIAKGIEKSLKIFERDFERENEKKFREIKTDDLKPEDPLFVGFDNGEFNYPSKGTFNMMEPVSLFWFLEAFYNNKWNVQSAMGWFHVLFFVGFLSLFYVRAFFS